MISNYIFTDMRGTSIDTIDDSETYDNYASELLQTHEAAPPAAKQGNSIEAILFADNGYNSFTD